MITFIPSWHAVSDTNLSTDDLMGQLQSFAEYDEGHYQILVRDYMPQLRYFLHRFDLLESPYVSLFDQLQGFENLEQGQLRLEDLPFPSPVTFSYASWTTWAYHQGELVGIIRLGEGAQISEVQYFTASVPTHTEIYDDRGFLSSRRVFEAGREVYTEYVDQKGEGIFICENETGRCLVNPKNTKGLLLSSYESLEHLIWERIELHLSGTKEDKVVVSLTDGNLPFVSQSPWLSQMTLSVFGERCTYPEDSLLSLRWAIRHAASILVESRFQYEKLSSYRSEGVFKLTPFDARFTLSATQEMKEEVLYVELRHLSSETWRPLLQYFLSYLLRLYENHDHRMVRLVLSSPWGQDKELLSLFSALVKAQFPEEVEILERQGEDGAENTVDEVLFLEDYPSLSLVERILESVEAKVMYSDEQVFEVMHEARLIVDLSEVPDLFIQIAGISAGIPHLNRVPSEYVKSGQNGLIIEGFEHLESGLDYYLDTFKEWNIARVFSIQQIKKYSGLALYERLNAILEGAANEE